jgi:hypothetical protein
MWQKVSNYGLKLYLQQIPNAKCIIGFDLGLKSTGVAISSMNLKHAFVLFCL